MKKVLLIISLLIVCAGYSQECKYTKNEIDKFTKKRVLQTKEAKLWGNLFSAINASGKIIDSTRYINLSIVLTSAFSINEGGELMFLLQNGNTITLKSMTYVVSDIFSTGQATVWTGNINFYLSDTEYDILANSEVSDFRIYFNDGYFEKAVKPQLKIKFMQMLACIK